MAIVNTDLCAKGKLYVTIQISFPEFLLTQLIMTHSEKVLCRCKRVHFGLHQLAKLSKRKGYTNGTHPPNPNNIP